ncbi:TIGR00730 family Rossman fold protein [Adlercreutzia sp. R7]|uniref:Cytokinin riboside 5'-monophosphate phosphoribohydrolase n=1 Tax=Adlercreutzia wanghongyangiae TaxID=3111451 RepID=A0ABU6IEU7_9ACTN|nr:TIGR00730 family Rossman fold protein [Adlercreutzia sp. R7]
MLSSFSDQLKHTNEENHMNITVYCGSNFGDDPRFEEAARALGAWIARAGHTLVYGGSSVGLMGTVSRAVIEGGAPVIGVEPAFFIEAGVAQHDLTDLIVCDTMGERKAKMIELGNVFVALPGGVGTLEEISEIITRVRLDLGPHECFLLNIDGFYDPLAAFLASMVDHRFFDQCDLDRCHFPRTVEELEHLVATADERSALRCDGPLLLQKAG